MNKETLNFVTPPPPPKNYKISSAFSYNFKSALTEVLRENIDYDLLCMERRYDAEEIDGYVELMAEICASGRGYIRVNGVDVPAELVKERFLKLNSEHIQYVMERLRSCTIQVVNIRAYILAALYNAPVTMGHYYTAQVSHDRAQGWGVGA